MANKRGGTVTGGARLQAVKPVGTLMILMAGVLAKLRELVWPLLMWNSGSLGAEVPAYIYM